MKIRNVLLSVALVSGAISSANAVPLQIDIVATISSTWGGFPAPKTFEYQAKFDTENLQGGSATTRTYWLTSSSVTVDGTTYQASGPGTLTYQDQVPYTVPMDRINGGSAFDFALGNINIKGIGFSLEGIDTIFGIQDVPFIPNASEFSNRFFYASFSGEACPSCSTYGLIDIDQISISPVASVPIPSSLALFTSGIIGLVLKRRSTHK